VWAEPEQKTGGLSAILRTALRKKFYCKPLVPVKTRHSESVPLAVSIILINNLKRENPKTEKIEKLGSGKFISSILSDVEKFAEFKLKSFFKSDQNCADVARKLRSRAYIEAYVMNHQLRNVSACSWGKHI